MQQVNELQHLSPTDESDERICATISDRNNAIYDGASLRGRVFQLEQAVQERDQKLKEQMKELNHLKQLRELDFLRLKTASLNTKQANAAQLKEKMRMEHLLVENSALKTTWRETVNNAENLRRTNYFLRSSRYAVLSSLDELQGENERIMARCLKRAKKFRDLKTAQKRLLKTHCETLKELELLKANHRKLSEQERENNQKLVAMEIRNSQLRVSYSNALAKVETLSKKKSHLLVNFHRVLKEKQNMKKIIKQTDRRGNRTPNQDERFKKSKFSENTCENASVTDLQVEAGAGSSERESADLEMCFAEKC